MSLSSMRWLSSSRGGRELAWNMGCAIFMCWTAWWRGDALPKAEAVPRGSTEFWDAARPTCLAATCTSSPCGRSAGGTSQTSPAAFRKRRLSLAYAGLRPQTLRAYRLSIDRFLKFVKKRHVPLRNPKSLDTSFLRSKGFTQNWDWSCPGPVSFFATGSAAMCPLGLFRPLGSWLKGSWALPFIRAMTPWPSCWPWALIACSAPARCWLSPTSTWCFTRRTGISLVLPGSKTSQGNPQVLLVTDSRLIRMARAVIIPTSSDLLWKQGPYQFRQRFAELLVHLHFDESSYTPYCLRRGGATWYFQTTLSLDATVTRGRWSCTRTARQYIDEGTAQLAQVSWSHQQKRSLRQWSRFLLKVRLRQEAKLGKAWGYPKICKEWMVRLLSQKPKRPQPPEAWPPGTGQSAVEGLDPCPRLSWALGLGCTVRASS